MRGMRIPRAPYRVFSLRSKLRAAAEAHGSDSRQPKPGRIDLITQAVNTISEQKH